MPVFDSPARLHAEAYALYREGKCPAAALVWAQARQAALTLGDRVEAFRLGFWEADATARAGDRRKARDMFFLLLSDVPPDAPSWELWWANCSAYMLQTRLRPEKALLERQLAGLERLSQRISVPVGDLSLLRAIPAVYQGDWAGALRHYAQSWREHDGTGYRRGSSAWEAGKCCLRLGGHDEARSWLQHLTATDQDKWAEARQDLRGLRILLALFDGDRPAVAEALAAGSSWSDFDLRGHLFRRASSLDPLDDPADSSHPARKLARFEREQNVHMRYDQLLALVDYRLACLRFTAGLPAVDDLYYQQPDVVPATCEPSDRTKLERQLRGFRFTWHLLRRHAGRLDALLECDWRTKEAVSRWDRARGIAAACNAELTLGLAPNHGLGDAG